MSCVLCDERTRKAKRTYDDFAFASSAGVRAAATPLSSGGATAAPRPIGRRAI